MYTSPPQQVWITGWQLICPYLGGVGESISDSSYCDMYTRVIRPSVCLSQSYTLLDGHPRVNGRFGDPNHQLKFALQIAVKPLQVAEWLL